MSITGLWNVLTWKGRVQSRLVGDISATILPRVAPLPEGFEKDWCYACLLAARAFVGKLVVGRLEATRTDGKTGDINPFHRYLDHLTPSGALHLFRLTAAYGLVDYLSDEENRMSLEDMNLSAETLEDTVSTVLGFDDEHSKTYRELVNIVSEDPLARIKLLCEKMLARGYGLEHTAEIAAIKHVGDLLSDAGKAFWDALIGDEPGGGGGGAGGVG